ncbi:MAG: cyanophycin synthetase [Halanaerobiales bacterium]
MKIISHRLMKGPNLYTYSPVIETICDLDSFDQVESKDIKGFNKSVIKYFPGLLDHSCSEGRKGGFLKRLKEGTYLGHIIEHLSLEIQVLLGYDVYYGKTIWIEGSCYKLITEYIVEEIAQFAVETALEFVLALAEQTDTELILNKLKNEGEKIVRRYGIGPSTRALIDSAKKRNIPVIPLDKENCLYQLGYGKRQKRIEATISSTTSCIAVDIASNKMQTNELLRDAGLPVPRGFILENIIELKDVICHLETPLVVKPFNCNHGKGVSLNINNWYELKKAFYRARKYSRKIIVEEYIVGKDYRLLVVGNRMIAAAERKPPHIRGDGKNNIRKLIEQINDSTLRGDGHEKPLTRIKIDEVIIKHLQAEGYNLDTIPEKNQIIFLRHNGNLSTGGTAEDITGQVHPLNMELAIRAAHVIGLDIAGIDIIAQDIRVPLLQQEGVIIEVNASPGIRMHLYPSIGKSRPAADAIIDHLFPDNDGRIPVISITGTNGKTTTTRLLAEIFSQVYENVGYTTTDGTYINDQCIIPGDNTGPISAKSLLKEPIVDIVILETARGGIIREGLGYHQSDIGVILNITEDHLGVDGIETLADLAFIKSLVIETVKKTGNCVLNADDPTVLRLSERASAPIVYFSQKNNNVIITNHCNNGGKAVYIENGNIVHQKGDLKEVVFRDVRNIPITFGGRAKHNVENILAATSVALSRGIDKRYIEKALSSFGSNWSDNTGRLNIFQTIGLKVILDYGHNPAGFEKVFKFMKKLEGERLVGIVGLPGDRNDDLIIKAGKIIADYLDVVYIKEDMDLRGRKAGEVAGLLRKALLENNYQGLYSYISAESDALEMALSNAIPGDIIVCFYEKNPEKLIRIIRQGMLEFETKEAVVDQKTRKSLIID